MNRPPPATPPPHDDAPAVPQIVHLALSARPSSFQEKAKLPYSASFAELQQSGRSGTSFGTEFNNDFDPMGDIYYGSFKGGSLKASVNAPGGGPSSMSQSFKRMPTAVENDFENGDQAEQDYDQYAAYYKQHGGGYPQQSGNDYDNNYYTTPPRQHYGPGYSNEQYRVDDHFAEQQYYENQQHQQQYEQDYDSQYYQQQPYEEENPYWRWDPNVGWVPKEEMEIPQEESYKAPVSTPMSGKMKMSLSRLGSGHGIARKKSSSSKKSRNGSGSFGGDIPDFEDQARQGSSPNMLGLAFGGGGSLKQSPTPSFADSSPIGNTTSPRSSLKGKKSSLWE